MTVVWFGIAFGLVMGVFTSRSSTKRDPIYGGAAPKAVHYITASTVTAMPVTIIAAAISNGLLFAVFVALGFAAVLWSSALIFAALERPSREAALAKQTERGWTEEDARTSGL